MNDTYTIIRDGDAWASVAYIGYTSEGRPRYQWMVGNGNFVLDSGSDIHGGCYTAPDEREALSTLGAFLGAYAEAMRWGRPDSENRDIFRPEVEAVAQELSDAIWLELEPEE